MGGVTDEVGGIALLGCTDEYQNCELELSALKQTHLETAKNLMLKREDRHHLDHDLEVAFTALENDIIALQSGTTHKDEIELRTAAVAAWGERLSVLLVAAAVCSAELDAVPVREEAIITNHPQSETPRSLGTGIGPEPLTEETRAQVQSVRYPL